MCYFYYFHSYVRASFLEMCQKKKKKKMCQKLLVASYLSVHLLNNENIKYNTCFLLYQITDEKLNSFSLLGRMQRSSAPLKLYASEVPLCSSEYGIARQRLQAYSSNNLVGRPRLYPRFGDSTRLFSLVRFCCLFDQ